MAQAPGAGDGNQFDQQFYASVRSLPSVQILIINIYHEEITIGNVNTCLCLTANFAN